MLGWLQQTFSPAPPAFDVGRFAHPALAESIAAISASGGDGLARRSRKRFERRPADADELQRLALAAGCTAAMDVQEQEDAAVAF